MSASDNDSIIETEHENRLFVGGLPINLTEKDLVNIFSCYGALSEVALMRQPYNHELQQEGYSKGCAFIKYMNHESATTAINLLHKVIPLGHTRNLVVKFANVKHHTSPQIHALYLPPLSIDFNRMKDSQLRDGDNDSAKESKKQEQAPTVPAYEKFGEAKSEEGGINIFFSSDELNMFDCCVCMDVLNMPVTLLCGHTSCKSCLVRAFKSKERCPYCRNPVDAKLPLQVNVTMSDFIEKAFPRLAESRKQVVAELEAAARLKAAQDALLPKLQHADGLYKGDVANGQANGVGIKEFNSGIKLVGIWANDHVIKGTLTWPDGASFKGCFDALSKPSGLGKLITSDGAIWDCQWLDGKPHGEGSYTGSDGSVYKSDFANATSDTTTTSDGTSAVFDRGLKQGTGCIFTYADGSSYRGDFFANKYHGQGMYQFRCGAYYEGR